MGYWGPGAMENDGALDIEGDFTDKALEFLMHFIRGTDEQLSKTYGGGLPALRAAGHLLVQHFPDSTDEIDEAIEAVQKRLDKPDLDEDYRKATQLDLDNWKQGKVTDQNGLMETILTGLAGA